MGDDSLLTRACLECLESHYVPFNLDIRHLGGHLLDTVYLAAVDVFVGEVLQKVIKVVDAEFVSQHLLPLRAYAGEVFYFGVEDGGHYFILGSRAKLARTVAGGLFTIHFLKSLRRF